VANFTGLRWRIQAASSGELNRPPVANSPARAAKMLGEDEKWLCELADQLEPEDGRL
jgi:hypothetical protein